jgi:6-phosphofructokinase 1
MPKAAAAKKNALNTSIPALGVAKIPSPLHYCRFIEQDETLELNLTEEESDIVGAHGQPMRFEKAGPRGKLYYDSSKVKCAIVTCGGLCPGINDVIRAIVMDAYHHYHVASVIGIRYGLQGFIPKYGHDIMELTPHNEIGRAHV